MMASTIGPLFLASLLLIAQCNALVQPSPNHATSRREAWGLLLTVPTAALLAPLPSLAAEGDVLTDEEMKARVARKLELQKASASGGGRKVSATDIRSDVNPEAGQNLRSRSVLENTKIALDKQEELKTRDKQQKRDDMCEMLGRGC